MKKRTVSKWSNCQSNKFSGTFSDMDMDMNMDHGPVSYTPPHEGRENGLRRQKSKSNASSVCPSVCLSTSWLSVLHWQYTFEVIFCSPAFFGWTLKLLCYCCWLHWHSQQGQSLLKLFWILYHLNFCFYWLLSHSLTVFGDCGEGLRVSWDQFFSPVMFLRWALLWKVSFFVCWEYG